MPFASRRAAVTAASTSVLALLAWACGSESSPSDPTLADADASAAADTGAPPRPDAAGTDSGSRSDADADAGSCGPVGDACDTGDVCATGKTACVSGVVTCEKSGFAPEGTTCAAGSCTRGSCSEDVTLTASANLSTDPIATGRTCAEAISYSVTGLTPTTATLAAPPAAGCLAPGDEVLVINLQGSAAATTNVGAFENLRVQAVAGDAVTFAAAKTKNFGEGAADDANIGTGDGQQKVMLMRVPRFGKLTVASVATITADAWDGLKGGVVAFRANAVTLDGMIDARALGYRGGRWSRDDDDCTQSVLTEAGESIGGRGAAGTAANGGGSGGISAGSAVFNTNTPLNASAGHGTPGEPGANAQDRVIGDPGGTYGAADGSKLTMGSGGGGNLTCEVGFAGPALVDVGRRAGGIIAVFGGNITVSSTGLIDARSPTNRTAASGGYVLLRGDVVDFSAGTVTAKGAIGDSLQGAFVNAGGDGRIAVFHKTSVAGTSTPTAFSQQTNTP